MNLAIFTTITDHATACLIVSRVRNGRYFFIDAHRWDPDFDIIGSCHRMGAIASGKLIQMIG